MGASTLRIFEPIGGRIFFPDIIGLLKIGGDFKGLRILSNIGLTPWPRLRNCGEAELAAITDLCSAGPRVQLGPVVRRVPADERYRAAPGRYGMWGADLQPYHRTAAALLRT